jgi:hypothetical protein
VPAEPELPQPTVWRTVHILSRAAWLTTSELVLRQSGVQALGHQLHDN